MLDSLDALIDDRELHGTFHDAYVTKVRPCTTCTELACSICVGDPDAASHSERERRRDVILRFVGVEAWEYDPPDAGLTNSTPAWLTADGCLSELDTIAARKFERRVPSHAIRHYLYFSNSNAFLLIACRSIEFNWLA